MPMREYPYIGKSRCNDFCVKFVSPSTGHVYSVGDKFKVYKVGHFSSCWAEYNFDKIEKEHNKVSKLKKGDLIIGSINKETGAVGFSVSPVAQPNFLVASKEAERLANISKDKKFIVCEIKGICSVTNVNWE